MDYHADPSSSTAPTNVSLGLRGHRLSLEREALMELPESVLLCLFPNGVVLSAQRQPRLDGTQDVDDREDVYFVDRLIRLLELEHHRPRLGLASPGMVYSAGDGAVSPRLPPCQLRRMSRRSRGWRTANHLKTQLVRPPVFHDSLPGMTGIVTVPEHHPWYSQFDAKCLEFVLNFFATARDAFYGPPQGPRRNLSESAQAAANNIPNPLFLKQAIIVLREELEYFAIPPKGKFNAAADSFIDEKHPPTTTADEIAGTDEAGKPNKTLLQLKLDCGKALLERKSIFTALQRNVNRENNVAEQHLIDMLCMSGFERDDAWGYRSLEPNRCCIASIALVLLKTGITHPPITLPEGETVRPSVDVNAQQLATAQKLLLFWRKPARKCWWDATELTLDEGTDQARQIRVWARRVWTLELSLI